MPTNKSTMTKLLTFRTIFLRCIAQAWADPAFKKQLLESPEQAIWAHFNFRWPWPNACEFQVVDTKHKFKWIDNEWVWSSSLHEDLTLFVPLDPSEIEPRYHAVALADYYRARESLFDDDWGDHDNPNSHLKPRDRQAAPRPATRRGEDEAPSPGHSRRRRDEGASSNLGGGSTIGVIGESTRLPAKGFMPNADDFTSFQVALLAGMGRAWQDPKFRDILQHDAMTALESIRGYKLPWNLNLRIQHDPGARWHPPYPPAPERPIYQSYWSLDKKHVLRLNLPDQPEKPVCEPIALAMYNATGAMYPFTCTC